MLPSPDGKQAPQRHHLDRRAADIAAEAAEGDCDDLMTTSELAEMLGISVQWLEIGRSKSYGPPFVRLSPRRVRYNRSDVIAWLAERTHAATSEYETGRPGRRSGSRVVDGRVVEPDRGGDAAA
jgi:predicted DNA-binding transcriptional regulator AlpA